MSCAGLPHRLTPVLPLMVPLCRVAAGCIVVSCSAFLLLLLERRGARWLEALFGAVIGMEAIAMSVNFFRAGVPAKEVALGLFRPTLPGNAIVPAVGALGALVMP